MYRQILTPLIFLTFYVHISITFEVKIIRKKKKEARETT